MVQVVAEACAPTLVVAPGPLPVSSASSCASLGTTIIRESCAPRTPVAPGCLPVSSAPVCAPYTLHKNLTLQCARRQGRGRDKAKVLLLCAGPDERDLSLVNLLRKCGADGENWDLQNGPQFDLADDATWDPLVVRVRSKEFAAAFASPPCTTASRLRNKPGGPPPLRGLTGAARYGLKGLTVPNKELVRLHNLILVRVAEILKIMVPGCLGCLRHLRSGKAKYPFYA
jgi:hypothetical protein